MTFIHAELICICKFLLKKVNQKILGALLLFDYFMFYELQFTSVCLKCNLWIQGYLNNPMGCINSGEKILLNPYSNDLTFKSTNLLS